MQSGVLSSETNLISYTLKRLLNQLPWLNSILRGDEITIKGGLSILPQYLSLNFKKQD